MFAVIFEVHPKPEAWDAYLGHAASLRPELLQIDGFISNERYRSQSRAGWLVSLSIWRDEKALIRWRTHALHHDIQGKGRSSVFADYHLRVGEIVTDSGYAGTLPQQRFDSTEAAAKAVSLVERALDADARSDGAGSDGARSDGAGSCSGGAEADSFDSITRPGNGLYLRSWPDVAAAEAGIAGAEGHRRVVRVIRDYGMFARVEAPQYFPA